MLLQPKNAFAQVTTAGVVNNWELGLKGCSFAATVNVEAYLLPETVLQSKYVEYSAELKPMTWVI